MQPEPSSDSPDTPPFLATPQTFDAFVNAWEAGVLPKEQWTHAAHVAVGACYAVRYPGLSLDHMRRGIIRHNEAVGTPNTDTSGYHETITRLWVGVLESAVAGCSGPWEAACLAVERFGSERSLYRCYYSFDVVCSVEARRIWVPPDLPGPNG